MTTTRHDILEHHGHTHPPAGATAELRHDHEIILRALAIAERLGRALRAGAPVDRAGLAWLVDFFRTFADRCHHGKEEQHLFPALERRGIPRDGGPIGTMLHEHEEGRRLLRAMGSADDAEVAAAIEGYATLLRAHIAKENDVLFMLAEQVLAEPEQTALARSFEAVEQEVVGPGVHERLLEGLSRLEAAGAAHETVLDVSDLPPRERHPRIFALLDRLPAGSTFVLVNDHDPKPLHYQMLAERPGQVTWQYLEQGPERWRVRIGRTS